MENTPPFQESIDTDSLFGRSVFPSKNTSSKEAVALLLATFIFYWVAYLSTNWIFRLGTGSGISIKPQEGSNQWQFFLFLIAAVISAGVGMIIYSLRKSGKIKFAILVLALPIIFFYIITQLLSFFSRGEESLGAAIIIGVGFLLLIGIYLAIFITNLVVYIVNKYKYSYTILIILSILIFIVPIIYTFLVENRFKSKMVSMNIPVKKVTLQKIQIDKSSYQAVGKLDSCCRILDVKLSGAVVLARLGSDKYLLQGPVRQYEDIYGQKVYKAPLLVEEGDKIIDIGKGADFAAFTNLTQIGEMTRPIFLSVSQNMVAFFEKYRSGGAFIISKLNGSGIYIDEDFCQLDCDVKWGEDGFIYLDALQKDNSTSYFRVTPP